MSRQALYLREAEIHLRKVRAANNSSLSEQLGYSLGMTAAGLFLNSLTEAEYERLWTLALNAFRHRQAELRAKQHPFGRTYPHAAPLEACA